MRNLAVMLCLLACSDPPARVCVPGETSVCVFPDGGRGTQVCDGDGMSVGPCQACNPGDLHACTLASGRPGAQTCRDDASGYGPCQ